MEERTKLQSFVTYALLFLYIKVRKLAIEERLVDFFLPSPRDEVAEGDMLDLHGHEDVGHEERSADYHVEPRFVGERDEFGEEP